MVLSVQRQRIVEGKGEVPPSIWCDGYRQWVRETYPDGVPPRDCYRCDGEGFYDETLCEVCGGFGHPRIERACPMCGGLEWIRAANVPVGHPQYGLSRACPRCAGGGRERIEIDVALALQQAHVPSGYAAYTLTSFLDRTGITMSQAESATLVAAWSSLGASFMAQHDRTGLVLSGKTGVGKTGLAVAGLAEAAHLVERPRFVSWLGLLAQVRHSWRHDDGVSLSEAIDVYGRAKVLVLDDFGTTGRGGAPEHAIELAEALWDARVSGSGLWTLATTNLPDIAAVEAEFGPRVASRVGGHCVWQTVTGPDGRTRPAGVVESLH
jgi:hypothetical protein